jgi:hypothetical protein
VDSPRRRKLLFSVPRITPEVLLVSRTLLLLDLALVVLRTRQTSLVLHSLLLLSAASEPLLNLLLQPSQEASSEILNHKGAFLAAKQPLKRNQQLPRRFSNNSNSLNKHKVPYLVLPEPLPNLKVSLAQSLSSLLLLSVNPKHREEFSRSLRKRQAASSEVNSLLVAFSERSKPNQWTLCKYRSPVFLVRSRPRKARCSEIMLRHPHPCLVGSRFYPRYNWL